MYNNLADRYSAEKRIKFIINKGYFTYLDVFNSVIRVHHGHALKSSGGIGGIFVPAYKAIGRWNEGKYADLDVFGHHHQSRNGGRFISNGSLIGTTAYSIRSCGFEPPTQKFFMWTNKKQVIAEYPLFL